MDSAVETIKSILIHQLLLFAAFLTIPVLIEAFIAKYVLKKQHPMTEGPTTMIIGIIEVATTAIVLYFLGGFITRNESIALFSFSRNWIYYVSIFFIAEFIFYASHFTSHKIRWFWNEHRVHHSSQEFNLFVGNRNGWTFAIAGMWMFTLPFVALGFRWEDLIAALFFILNYQFFIHTELVRTLGPLEYLVQTPSLHRVHHATQDQYIDKNFGGITLLFDYLFGTLQRELPHLSPAYGLRDEPVHKNALSIVLHGWLQTLSDVFKAQNWASRLKALVFLKDRSRDILASRPDHSYDMLNPLSLSLFRIALGLIWMFILVYRITEVRYFFSEDGILPLNEALKLSGDHRFSLLFWSESINWTYLLFSVGILSSLGLVLGVYANLSAAVGWLVCISLLNRTEVIISGGDMYMMVFLLSAAFLPLDRHFSLRPTQPNPSWFQTQVYPSAQLVFVVQIACIYFFTGMLKHGDLWRSGEALSVILQLKMTTRDLGRYLTQFPETLKVITYLIPWFEMAALVLLLPFRRTAWIRNIWLGLAFAMHVSILFLMNVFYLPYVCMVALLALIPGEFWTATLNLRAPDLVGRLKTLRPATISFAILGSLLVVSLNIHSSVHPVFPKQAYQYIEKFRLEQYWNFFGPSPRQANSWWRIHGKTDQGEDWHWSEAKPGFEDMEPLYPTRMYKSLDWAVFFLGLTFPDYQEKLLPILAKHLCRQPNASMVSSGELPKEIEIALFEARVFPVSTEPKKIKEFHQHCGYSPLVLE